MHWSDVNAKPINETVNATPRNETGPYPKKTFIRTTCNKRPDQVLDHAIFIVTYLKEEMENVKMLICLFLIKYMAESNMKTH